MIQFIINLFKTKYKTTVVSSTHTWSKVYEKGVTNSAEGGVTFKGIGFKKTIVTNDKNANGKGGSHTQTLKLGSNVPCVALPYTAVSCIYMAYKGEIEVGYTIHWKNGSQTKGVYQGEGWNLKTIVQTNPL